MTVILTIPSFIAEKKKTFCELTQKNSNYIRASTALSRLLFRSHKRIRALAIFAYAAENLRIITFYLFGHT